MFSTLMNERHHTKIAVFGGKPGEKMEFKGEWGVRYSGLLPPLDTDMCLLSGSWCSMVFGIGTLDSSWLMLLWLDLGAGLGRYGG